jgi:hypothetical protein
MLNFKTSERGVSFKLHAVRMMHQNLWQEQGEPAGLPADLCHRIVVEDLQHSHKI